MGVYHAVFCPSLKEYVERGNIKARGYENPDDAGAMVYLMATRWLGHEVVFTNDAGAGPYDLLFDKAEPEKWLNVWPLIVKEWAEARAAETAHYRRLNWEGVPLPN